MIHDADLTAAPEDLPKFFRAWSQAKASSSMEADWSTPWKPGRCDFELLRQPVLRHLVHVAAEQRIRDTLCGTKVLRGHTMSGSPPTGNTSVNSTRSAIST